MQYPLLVGTRIGPFDYLNGNQVVKGNACYSGIVVVLGVCLRSQCSQTSQGRVPCRLLRSSDVAKCMRIQLRGPYCNLFSTDGHRVDAWGAEAKANQIERRQAKRSANKQKKKDEPVQLKYTDPKHLLSGLV
jgi:hypothetical protein